ncbi:extradiol dioxygenase [Actinomadura rubrisoli]|uniref:Extradiol dioxygenase n=2 Tax=Actinomadura rubrisoli TaxID=2530368 RepID=A0A4R5C5N7_9ACTN|nr:extradiol dioxygenase [Actinomadura rubrisoli]
MSHAPGIVGWPEKVEENQLARISTAVDRIAGYLEDVRPDVVVAFLDDHFENIFRSMAPTFAIPVAESHQGPADYFVKVLRMDAPVEIPGAPEFAGQLLRQTVHAGFDVTRMGRIDYGNNLMAVWNLIRPQNDLPVVPIFVNVYHPPLPTMDRAYEFGAAVRRAIESMPGGERVLILSTGGLSHWPPIWLEHIQDWPEVMQPYLERIKRYQFEGRSVLKDDPKLFHDMGVYERLMADVMDKPVVAPEWDRHFLDLIAAGDAGAVRALTYGEIESNAGFGAHEVLNWAAGMGAMDGAPATVLNYEPVPEWICGMGFAIYDTPSTDGRTTSRRKEA